MFLLSFFPPRDCYLAQNMTKQKRWIRQKTNGRLLPPFRFVVYYKSTVILLSKNSVLQNVLFLIHHSILSFYLLNKDVNTRVSSKAGTALMLIFSTYSYNWMLWNVFQFSLHGYKRSSLHHPLFYFSPEVNKTHEVLRPQHNPMNSTRWPLQSDARDSFHKCRINFSLQSNSPDQQLMLFLC